MSLSFEAWEQKSDALCKQLDNFRSNYSCKENCDAWKKWEFCEHLTEARARKFSKKIDVQIEELVQINNSF